MILRRAAHASWPIIIAPLACVAVASDVHAQSQPRLSVTASASQVEVGETFAVELKAMVDQGEPEPTSTELAPPRDFDVVGKTERRQVSVQQRGSSMSMQVGIVVTWQLVGKRTGRFTLQGPTVVWSGRRLTTSTIPIEVVASTGQPRQRRSNPFLIPGGPNFPFPFPGFPQDDEPVAEPKTVPELALPAAPDEGIFVRIKLDKKNVVVGQQISASTYVYRNIRAPSILSSHEAPLSDFLHVALNKNPGAEPAVLAMVGGSKYAVETVDQVALFPLKAGDLHTGRARYTFGGATLRAPVDRASEDQIVHVTEPPRTGRPPGYVLGDVGQFMLASDVRPRRVDQGGEVAVTLKLSGTGNLPQSLRVPERTGLEWLDPEKKESIEPQHGVIGGWRTFGYVVRVKDAGTIDLGEVTLPYWDPSTNKYQIARTSLGTIEVAQKMPPVDPATKQPLEQPAPDPFAAMPLARKTLGGYTPPKPQLLDGRSMWWLIATPPLVVGVFSAGMGAARRARASRAKTKDAPATLAQRALAEARTAEASGDGNALASALERAIHLAVEAATGLKSRGVLVADLPAELTERGVSEALADDIAKALAACEAVRFDPSPDAAATRDLAARARAVVADLGRVRAS